MIRISKSPQERRQEIICAALELFLANGYEKTSVSMIVERVGVAQGLFYYYFKSKEDVFHAAMQYYADVLAHELIGQLLCEEPLSVAKRFSNVITSIHKMFNSSEPLLDGFSVRDRTDIDILFSYQLSLTLIEPVALLLELLSKKAHIQVGPTHPLAAFIVFGIYGLIHGHHDLSHNTESLHPDLLIPLFARIIGVSEDVLINEIIIIPKEYFI